MYIAAVNVEIKPDHVNDFLPLIKLHSDNSRNKESECHTFNVHQDPEDETKFFLYEVYTNKEAFESHQKTEHYAYFGETATDWIAKLDIHCFETIHP